MLDLDLGAVLLSVTDISLLFVVNGKFVEPSVAMALSALSAAQVYKALAILSIIVFGAIALIHWRRAAVGLRKPLGLVLDRMTGIDFCVGTLIGTFAMVVIVAVELALGQLQMKVSAFGGHHIIQSASSYLISGFIEELLCRGFLLSGLIIVIRQRWIAVAVMAGIFGALHGANPHATALSIFSNALGGVTYAIAYLGSKRLWLGTGIHFAWNVIQGPVLGFAVSGGKMLWGGLFTESVRGPDWLTGGSFGPEGGLICIGFRFLVVGLILVWLSYSNRLVFSPRRFADDGSRLV